MAFGCLIYFLLPTEPSLYWGVAGLVIGLTGCAIIRCRFTAYLGWYQMCCALFLVSSGFCLSWWQTHRQEPFYHVPFHATTIQGKIKAVEYLNSGKKRVSIQYVRFLTPPESDQQEWQRLVLFTLSKNDTQILENGDLIQARVMLHRPSSPQLVGGYDLQFYSWFKNIGAYGYALEPVKIISFQPAYSIQYLREKIAAHIRKLEPGSAGVISQILLTGIGGELTQQERHAFAASGLAHLLAIAGLHLGIVMSIVTFTVRWLLLRSEYIALYWPVKRIAIIIGWSIGCFYLVLTGLHLPAIRSLLMASIVMLALLCNRPAFSKHNLMLAALFLLLLSPASVLNVSFQMSMAAVMALVSGFQLIYQWIGKGHVQDSYFYRFIKIYLLEAAWVSVLAGTAVVPVIMFYFHELNLYFVFANLIAVPLMAFWILPMGLLALCTMPFGLDAIFIKLMCFGIDGVMFLAEWVACLPYASIAIPVFPGWGYCVYFFGLCVLCLCITPLRWSGGIMMVVGISSIFLVNPPDIVTAANGRMIGIKNKQQLLTICQGNCDNSTLEEWRKVLHVNSVKNIALDDHDYNYNCNQDYCFFYVQKIIVMFNAVQKEQNACQPGLLEFSFLWNGSVCQYGFAINKKSNWINGAHSIWLTPFKVRTDLQNRGKRPWVMQPIQRGIPKLPMAQTE
ncbi:ComEC/Rec2 family competence protein [Commensalibacter papalotli (ex Botero et al. 2024)]|uniref:N-terminal domain (ComEC) n=1 Tax=Commensalibacter papalotli (ex Botero et al. 2024) TaxID=2972766 RepID=A0ABN8W9W7_9PROT|nr:ComEC/Rec2 family competence protein [Commensalibacter papalotli (ex Botero et al. 2024)]CAI3935271.1 DNA uptake channel protein ComEC [Commensalibacter papalotli (ex Botero et al. 2024)]CAI3940461.1 DNA uptake channel protein ComEC [Commensalibacter papalotli (ex Botero et al. 2024)]